MSGAMLMMSVGGNDPLVGFVSPATANDTYRCVGYPPSVCVSPQVITTNAVVVTYTGGDGSSPTYAWAKVSGDTHTITSPTSASTTFSKSVERVESFSAVYRCTLTVGSETALLDVPVTTFYDYETGA